MALSGQHPGYRIIFNYPLNINTQAIGTGSFKAYFSTQAHYHIATFREKLDIYLI
jgi:hypothetical protein